MSNALLSHPRRLTSTPIPGAGASVAVALAVWFVIVFLLGASEVFAVTPGTPPLALLVATATPVAALVAAFSASRSFRELVLAADLPFLTGLQAWRIGGFTFLALNSFGLLPGYFAWPAGLGDIAVGVTAPWVLAALVRRPAFAATRTFVAWQFFGIVDLVAAVGIGALGARFLGLDPVAAGATAPMAHLPLVLVPAFFVPAFVLLHLAALAQARRFAREYRR
jgi:hypothetical protein